MKTGSEAAAAPAILEKTISEALHEAVSRAGTQPDAGARSAVDVLLGREEDDGHWPKTVQEFQDGGYLEPGDVLVMTKLGSLFSTLMWIFAKSDFAHSALVFQTPHHEHGIDFVYLIESSMSGVDIETFNEIVAPSKVYRDVKLPPDFVVGVKRLETDWATPSMRRMASSRMLHFINNDDYDFGMLVALATKQTANAYFKLLRFLRGPAPTVSEYLAEGIHFSPAEFICSGFVQFAYIDMVKVAIERGMIHKSIAEQAWNDVLFSKNINGDTSMKQLLAVKPDELATTPKLKWKYIINRGMVRKVESNEQVDGYFDEIKVSHRKLAPRA